MSGDRRFAALAALALTVLTAAGTTARAQTMDYGALEQTFGEPVTASATGTPLRATDAPVDMIIVTADEIRRSGAHDIPGVLRHVAGIDVLQWTNDDSDVSVRGYDQAYSPRLLVLIDGRQVYADYYGFTPWSALPVELNAIRQIEIVKGPSTALFGFNAVGGVINIVTYSPQYDDQNALSLGLGSQSLTEGSAVLTAHDGDQASLRAVFGGRTDDDFSTPVPADVAGPQRRGDYRGEADLKGAVTLGEGVEMGLEASHSIAAENAILPTLTLGNSVFETDSLKGRVSAYAADGLIELTAYSNWIVERARFLSQGATDDLRLGNQVTVVRLQDLLTLGNDSTIRIAGEYRHNSAGTTPVTGATVSYDDLSEGAMWAWTLLPALSLTNAVRVDQLWLARSGFAPPDYPFVNVDWNRRFTEESFNSGLVWRVDDADTLRAIASRGVQLPNLIDLGAALIESPFVSVTGTPRLEPTTVMNYELAWDRAWDEIGGKFRASLFDQKTDGVISNSGGLVFTASGVWATPADIGNSRADGTELSLQGTLGHDWRWGASYRYEIVHDAFLPLARDGTDFLDYAGATPDHLVKVNLGWAGGPWEIDGYALYQSRTDGIVPNASDTDTVEVPIANYVSFDGRIGFRLKDTLTLALAAQNIAPSRQQQTSGPDVERRVIFTVTATP